MGLESLKMTEVSSDTRCNFCYATAVESKGRKWAIHTGGYGGNHPFHLECFKTMLLGRSLPHLCPLCRVDIDVYSMSTLREVFGWFLLRNRQGKKIMGLAGLGTAMGALMGGGVGILIEGMRIKSFHLSINTTAYSLVIGGIISTVSTVALPYLGKMEGKAKVVVVGLSGVVAGLASGGSIIAIKVFTQRKFGFGLTSLGYTLAVSKFTWLLVEMMKTENDMIDSFLDRSVQKIVGLFLLPILNKYESASSGDAT